MCWECLGCTQLNSTLSTMKISKARKLSKLHELRNVLCYKRKRHDYCSSGIFIVWGGKCTVVSQNQWHHNGKGVCVCAHEKRKQQRANNKHKKKLFNVALFEHSLICIHHIFWRMKMGFGYVCANTKEVNESKRLLLPFFVVQLFAFIFMRFLSPTHGIEEKLLSGALIESDYWGDRRECEKNGLKVHLWKGLKIMAMVHVIQFLWFRLLNRLFAVLFFFFLVIVVFPAANFFSWIVSNVPALTTVHWTS